MKLAALLLLALLTGCSGFGGGRPMPGDGVLTLVNQRSGERATLQFRRGGQFDSRAMQHAAYLMRDQRTGQVGPLDPNLLLFLDDVCGVLGLPPGAPVVITSGYRSPQSNAELRRRSGQVAENSYHLRGAALDFKIPGIAGWRVGQAAQSLRRGGVAYYKSSDHVHIDTGPPRSWKAY